MHSLATLSRGLLFLALFGFACGREPGIFDSRALAADETPGAQIRLVEAENGKRLFEVSGLPAELAARLAQASSNDSLWPATFAVYVAAEQPLEGNQPPAMAGSYSLKGGVLRFQPRYPLEPGLRYRAVFRKASQSIKASPLAKVFAIPNAPPGEPTKIAAVYPTSNRLPENQLKFYLHFSAPMSRGQAYEHVQLLDAQDRPIELPFLELGEELWTPDGRRFTLLFDPGRIKRGLKPREEAGPVLEEGKTYTLVVDSAWEDSAGRPLAAGFRKSFSVGPPDNSPPDPANWKLKAPQAGTREPLTVKFPEPLDHALLERLLTVKTADGDRVPGMITIDEQETRWRFQPQDDSWRVGRYQLVVGKTLEDRAGNSIERPFEVDEVRPVTRRLSQEEVRLPFDVK